MPRVCTVCAHPERDKIDRALALESSSFRDIAGHYGLGKSAVERHAAGHLPAKLAKAQAAKEVAQADDIMAQVIDLNERTLALLAKAEAADDIGAALRAIREARENLTLLARLAGELAQINIIIAPQWIQLRAIIWEALTPYPEAVEALDVRLAAFESSGG